MNNPNQNILGFFTIIGDWQAYLKMLYLLAAFPLGVFYFVFIVSGFSIGLSLVIIWVGIPILLVFYFLLWVSANFERLIAIHMLKEDIKAMAVPPKEDGDFRTRIKAHFSNPSTWKSILYLLLKFPLGIATFTLLATLISLTLAFLTMPLSYEFMHTSQTGIFFSSDIPVWTIDSLGDAFLLASIGLILWPVTMHISNGLAWIHAKFARIMLSNQTIGLLEAVTHTL